MRRQVVFGLMCGILAWVGSFGSEDFDPLPPIVSRNGTAAPQGKYPFLVFLSIQFAGPVVQNCTGVLISERHVITSESCFFHSNGERIVPFKDNDVVLVHAGVVNRSLDEGQFRLTSNVSNRFGDNPLRSRFGITVITVEPFDLTNQIQPIGLAGWEDAVVLPYKALYVGWGTVGWNLKSNTRQLTEEVMDAVLPFALSVRQPLTGLMTIPEGEFATNVYKEVVTYVPHLGNALLKQVKNKHVLMGVVLQDANYAIQPKIVSAEGIWYYCKQIKVETEGQVKCG